MSQPSQPIFTIGHSTHSIESFIAILQHHRIAVIVDVRAVPDSKYAPDFNREPLQQSLRHHGMIYLYLGDAPGIRPGHHSPASTEIDRADAEQLRASEQFRGGIARVIRGAKRYRIALMCAEEDPALCHRALLVGEALDQRSLVVQHIRAPDKCEPNRSFLESHQSLLER